MTSRGQRLASAMRNEFVLNCYYYNNTNESLIHANDTHVSCNYSIGNI